MARSYDGSAHAPSFLQIAEPDDAVFVVNQFLEAMGDDGLAHRLACPPASSTRNVDDVGREQHRSYDLRAMGCACGALAAGRRVPRRDARTLRNGREVVRKFLSAQNRIRWIGPEAAFYGFLHVEGMTDSLGFASDLVRKARVGVAPGSAFARPKIRVPIPLSASVLRRTRRVWRSGSNGWGKRWRGFRGAIFARPNSLFSGNLQGILRNAPAPVFRAEKQQANQAIARKFPYVGRREFAGNFCAATGISRACSGAAVSLPVPTGVKCDRAADLNFSAEKRYFARDPREANGAEPSPTTN